MLGECVRSLAIRSHFGSNGRRQHASPRYLEQTHPRSQAHPRPQARPRPQAHPRPSHRYVCLTSSLILRLRYFSMPRSSERPSQASIEFIPSSPSPEFEPLAYDPYDRPPPPQLPLTRMGKFARSYKKRRSSAAYSLLLHSGKPLRPNRSSSSSVPSSSLIKEVREWCTRQNQRQKGATGVKRATGVQVNQRRCANNKAR